MVIKHIDAKNGTLFMYADTVKTKNFFIDPKTVSNIISEWQTTEIGAETTLAEISNAAVCKFVKDSVFNCWGTRNIEFISNGSFTEYVKLVSKKKITEELKSAGMLLAVLLEYPDKAKNKILVVDECTYLMTDDGKTVEKLI